MGALCDDDVVLHGGDPRGVAWARQRVSGQAMRTGIRHDPCGYGRDPTSGSIGCVVIRMIASTLLRLLVLDVGPTLRALPADVVAVDLAVIIARAKVNDDEAACASNLHQNDVFHALSASTAG